MIICRRTYYRRHDGHRGIDEVRGCPIWRRGRSARLQLPVAVRGRGLGEISATSGSVRRRPDRGLRPGRGPVQERPEADGRSDGNHAGRQAQETVHLHVLWPRVQQVVQPAHTRQDPHGRASLPLWRVRQGVPQTGPPQGSQVIMKTQYYKL